MTGAALEAPRKLTRDDDRSRFESGAVELDDWFRRFSWENQQANNAVTYVTVLDDAVMGYYAIASAGYAKEDLPDRLRKNRPDQVGCILLARLAVDRTAQGQGVGAALLKDAIQRSYQLSQGVGAAAFLVHCRDEAARRFYLKNGDFLSSPMDDMHLLLPMKEIRRRLMSAS